MWLVEIRAPAWRGPGTGHVLSDPQAAWFCRCQGTAQPGTQTLLSPKKTRERRIAEHCGPANVTGNEITRPQNLPPTPCPKASPEERSIGRYWKRLHWPPGRHKKDAFLPARLVILDLVRDTERICQDSQRPYNMKPHSARDAFVFAFQDAPSQSGPLSNTSHQSQQTFPENLRHARCHRDPTLPKYRVWAHFL